MKKLTLFLLAALSLSAQAFGQAARFDGVAQSTRSVNGITLTIPLPSATITVYNFGTSTKATVCPDITAVGCTSSAPNNPVTSDAQGNFGFWVPGGVYDYTVTPSSGTVQGPYHAVVPFGALASGAVTYSRNFENIRYADQFAGADAGAKIAAAIADLPSTGGTVNAKAFEGAQASASNPFAGVTKSVILLLGNATYTTDVQWTVPNKSGIIGVGTPSLIKASASFPINTPVVRIGNGSGIITGGFVREFKIDCSSISGCEGVYTTEANELSDIEKVTVTNYMTYGIHLLGSANGPGQFAIRDPYLLSSASATGAIGIYVDTTGGNLIMVEHGTCDNNGGIQQSACVKTNGSTQLAVHDMHVEDVVDGVYFAAGSAGQADGIVGHNSVTNTVTVATTGEVALLDINKNAGTNSINDTNKSILITENRVAHYAVGHTTANLLTTATQVNRVFGLTVNNASDATQTARFSGGSAASQIVDLTLQDIGSDKWKIEKDASNLFRIRDTAASDNTRLSLTTAGVTNFSAGGTAAVCLQCNTNAGTGGVEGDSGGASPFKVWGFDSAGILTWAQQSVAANKFITAGVPTGTRTITWQDASGTVGLLGTAQSWTASQTYTDGSFAGGNAPTVAYVTSAYTNATTTFSNVTGLSFAVGASKNYKATCRITWQGSANTAGPKYQFTGPAAPTGVAVGMNSVVTATTTIAASATAFSSPVANTGAVTATTNFTDTIDIGVVNGANAGTVQLQAAANGVGTLTIQPGSYCSIQ